MIILADKRTNIHTDFGVFFMDDEDAVGDAVGKFTLFGMKLFQVTSVRTATTTAAAARSHPQRFLFSREAFLLSASSAS